MKLFLSIFAVFLSCGAIFFFQEKQEVNGDYFRIHVTAHSNSAKDEQTKHMVKDAVVDFLIPPLSEAQTKEQAQKIVEDNMAKINEVVAETLKQNEVDYAATVEINQEKIPFRVYDGLVLDEGVYDCISIRLGDAKGDNWWCVVFPAVCFISSKNYDNLEYISKIWEIINNVT